MQPGTLPVDVGEHTVEASAPGYRATERKVRVAGEQSAELKLQLEPFELSPAHVANASAAESGAQPPADTARDTGGGSVLSRWWFWTAVGVVVAGAAVGTVLALSGGDKTAAADRGSGGVVLQPPR